jgi:hypothetical protein
VKPVFVRIFLLAWLLAAGQWVRCQDTTDLYPAIAGSLVCQTETRSLPRPLRIYSIRVDLTCRSLEVCTLTGADPDGPGPAESTLTMPSELFSGLKLIAAVNANAFAGLPGTENDIRGWYNNRPVDIHGMVVSDGRVVSPAEQGRTAFWLDRRMHPHLGDPKPGDTVNQAVSDWSTPLLVNDTLIPDPATTTLHPRTALGFDDSGKWLLLVVVDGRQPGFSEGMSLYEIATLLRSKGCTQALNLDGGGSSIMMIKDYDGVIKTVNRPSGLLHRPVPVMLGIRRTRNN